MGWIGSGIYLAGSSKTAPRILIFSIAMGADYSFEVKNIEIWAPAFFKHKQSFVATVFEHWRLNLSDQFSNESSEKSLKQNTYLTYCY
jgi:hypothetical protein